MQLSSSIYYLLHTYLDKLLLYGLHLLSALSKAPKSRPFIIR